MKQPLKYAFKCTSWHFKKWQRANPQTLFEINKHNWHKFQPSLFPSPRFWSVSSTLNWGGAMDTDSFYLAWGKAQRDDNAIAGLWETAHFLIHPSFMKWGIGEALFNNEINSSSGDSWIVSFWRRNPQPAEIATSIAFDSVVFLLRLWRTNNVS